MNKSKRHESTPTDRAYIYIKQMLFEGKLAQGERVSYAELSRQTNLSHTPIREAINRLVSDGFLQLVPNVGAVVKKFDEQELVELYEMRELLEGYAVFCCANRISRLQLRRLEKIIADQRQMLVELRNSEEKTLSLEQYKKFYALDAAFHYGIVEEAGNKILSRMIGEIRFFAVLSWALLQKSYTFSELVRIYAYHKRIFNLIEKGEAQKARQQAIGHIRAGLKKHFDRLEQASPLDADRINADTSWYVPK